MDDMIRNQSLWQLQRKVGFYLDLVQTGVSLASAFTLSTLIFGTPDGTSAILTQAAQNPTVTSVLIWLGLTSFANAGGPRDTPLAVVVRSITAAVSLGFKLKRNEILTAFRDYLSHDQTNFFLAKHLSYAGIAKKYVKVFFENEVPGIEMEIFKDWPNEFKWYHRLKHSVEVGSKKIANNHKSLETLAGLVPRTITWFPKNSSSAFQFGLNLAVVYGFGLAAGMAAFSPEWIFIASAITLIGGFIQGQVAKVKTITPALGILYRRINSFILGMAPIMGLTAANFGLISYTSGLGISFLTLAILTKILMQKSKATREIFVAKSNQPRLV
jgi:hypothetical protein